MVSKTFTELLPEGVRFNFLDSWPRLTVCFNRPTLHEITQVMEGDCQFHIVLVGQVLFLLSKFGSLNWMDTPFHIQLYPAELRARNAKFVHGDRYLLMAKLVDGLTGHEHGYRWVTWNPVFSSAFHNLIDQQELQGFDPSRYDQNLSRAYEDFPKTTNMLSRSISHTKGGT